ncbi:MAG: hypothetical protein ABIO94_11110, partial [Opitutaceae bacterium]
MTSSPSSVVVEPFPLRVLHLLLSLGLALILVFLVTLGLLSASANLREIFLGLFSDWSSTFTPSPSTMNTVYALMPGAVVVV